MLDEIFLHHADTNFALEVSSMDYGSLRKTGFEYRLNEGAQWIALAGNTLYFNQLPAGTYRLEVRANTGDSNHSSMPSPLLIHVLPPFWLSPWAHAVYILLCCAIVLFTVLRVRKKALVRMQMQKLEMNMAKQHEMEEAKMRFFTNVSHDLRTPLSLIITPLEKLLAAEISNKSLRGELKLIYRHANLLMSEVNQLLELRRLDNGKSVLSLSHGNLPKFVKEVCQSFEYYANKKEVRTDRVIQTPSIEMDFDKNKIRRVLMNLLSNAVKFNTDRGSIVITVDLIVGPEGEVARIQVADTGIGIREENKPLIFERFYQEDHSSAYIGSGIGLHIVKEYVEMHGGGITVKDNAPQGSIFTVTLPVPGRSGNMEKPEVPEAEEVPMPDEDQECPILVVEDNDDFRQFLINCLKDHYPVVAAPHGRKALAILAQQPVRMVISDVMMPVMDGLELCNKIKGDIRFSHIPTILLTARTADEHRLNGLKEGADDYITKPFNLEILLLRVHKLLEWRKNSHKRFRAVDVEPSEITISSLDEQLIAKAIKLVEENIDNPDFTVEELSSAVGMTRGHLYKKLILITGKSPVEFIRVLLIKRGRQLLEKSQLSVAEIAYQVGLSPKQFTKHFKDAYGELPSAYKKKGEEPPA
ncbi:MAG: response regulator [Bacteroides sp.]|nr:response regulator [Bacteroides sp.]